VKTPSSLTRLLTFAVLAVASALSVEAGITSKRVRPAIMERATAPRIVADADINFREEVRAQLAALKGSLKVASRT
jgi:hypothetical protein